MRLDWNWRKVKPAAKSYAVRLTLTDLDETDAELYKKFLLRVFEPEMTDGQAFVTTQEDKP